MTARSVWFVVPEGFDDPRRVSGGNVYDQRVSAELRTLGWDVRVLEARPADDRGGKQLIEEDPAMLSGGEKNAYDKAASGPVPPAAVQ